MFRIAKMAPKTAFQFPHRIVRVVHPVVRERAAMRRGIVRVLVAVRSVRRDRVVELAVDIHQRERSLGRLPEPCGHAFLFFAFPMSVPSLSW